MPLLNGSKQIDHLLTIKIKTMGKKAKEHRKKVQARNARIKAEQNAYNKRMNQMMEQMMS